MDDGFESLVTVVVDAFDFGICVREFRESMKLSQKQVAARIGVSTTTIKSYEAGVALPKYAHLRKLALLFGVSSDTLLGLKHELVIDCKGLTPSQIEIISDNAKRVAAEFRGLNKQRSDR